VVLQSTSETEENEIRCSTLTTTTHGLANWLWLLKFDASSRVKNNKQQTDQEISQHIF
jgi:hypothetical protein